MASISRALELIKQELHQLIPASVIEQIGQDRAEVQEGPDGPGLQGHDLDGAAAGRAFEPSLGLYDQPSDPAAPNEGLGAGVETASARVCVSRPARGPEKRGMVRRLRRLGPDTAVRFVDWTILRMSPPLRHGGGWRGQPIRVPITGENAKRALFGSINIRSGHRVVLWRNQAGQANFQAFLWELRDRYGDRPLVLLLDKASSHTAPASQALAAELDMALIWLPKQRPELNGMDQLWKEMKKVSSSSRSRDPGIPNATSAAWAAILYAMHPCFTSSFFGNPRCSLGVT
jgi:hypothetical protein